MDKYDTSQLTEFPRFESESSQSGVSTFFNKIWKFPMFSPSETADNASNKTSLNSTQQTSQLIGSDKRDYEDVKTEPGTYAVEYEGRSLPNVLKRISSLVALGSGSGARYADTELAQYWMPDDISRECYECASRFSTLRRRHHCRVCGQIFCSRCCSQRVPGHIFGCAEGLRVCNYCCNVVLSYLKENDLTGEISPDLRTLQENLQVKFPDNTKHHMSNKSRDNFMFASEHEDRCEMRSSPKEVLQDVFRQLSFTLATQQHRYRLVKYNGVWRGCDILQWVMDNTDNKTRAQANLMCEGLLGTGYIECVTDLPHFADYALYKPIVLPPSASEEHEATDEGKKMIGSVSSYCLDLNLGDSSARLTKAHKTEAKSSSSEEDDTPVSEHIEEENNICKAIAESGEDHLKLLMRQCLARESLSSAWLDVLYPLCQQAAEVIMPDVFSNDMDVRNYVQVKKVSGASIKDSCLVHGVVLTKNVTHRGMPQQISNPTILLLDCSISYQRVEGKLTSLEPLLLQEQEYLVRCAARITSLRPKVVLVKGSTAHVVQDALRRDGVALAVGVRDRALYRAARCTKADTVTSIDARIGVPKLGTCKNFYIKTYSGKTLMVLEGGAEPHLGCCILLRGASLSELVRVKKVAKFMLLACYNWKLEKAFLADIDALLPEPGMNFGNDTESDDDRDLSSDHKNDVTNSENAIENDFVINNETTHKNKDSNNTQKEDAIFIDKSESSDILLLKSDDVFQNDVTIQNNLDSKNTIEEESNNLHHNNVNDTHNKPVVYDMTETKKSDIGDPLFKTKTFVRKTDSDKNLSCGVPIRDFSDPLRASVDDDVFLPKVETKLKADSHSDRWSTDDVVLSMSPNVIIPAPFLETEAGRKCPFRTYFPRPLFKQVSHTPLTPRALHRTISKPRQSVTEIKELHPFIKNPITSSIDDPALRALLAHFRATGGRIANDIHKPECPLYNHPSVVKKIQKEAEIETVEKQYENETLDPFSPENHQRLSLLLYSYSKNSANVPDFCVNPWIATMEMYGRHDISLGAFLHKYCFNGNLKCSSTNCSVPMNQHVRRFVHGDVCITITCNTIGHSNVDKMKDDQSNQVMWWSRCERCGVAGRARRLSRSALSLSLAQYVRLRAAAPRYVRAACPHPLHAHQHAFVSHLTTACFRYSKISTCDIQLPPDVISVKYDTRHMRDALIAQLNDLMHKGHETFSSLTESEADKDYQLFKVHMEHIHLALTSANLQDNDTLAAVVRNLWSVSDRIIFGEKMLRDAQDKWSSPPTKPAKSLPEINVEEKSDVEELATENSNESSGTTYVFSSDSSGKDNEKEQSEEEEEKGDKKTVKQVLSQLLTNNQPSNQNGMIISSGLIPVVVMAGEIGSVIAATLASVTYQHTLRANRYNSQTEQEDIENSTSGGKDKADGEKSKAAKSNDHIEVLLKDGLMCRVYYAVQFQKLRHMLMAGLSSNPHIRDEFAGGGTPPAEETHKCGCEDGREKADSKNLCEIDEGFIRSLAHCVPWAARGGKSGSTFCKTKDDRYVLKEMTKPEWQQFLEFAPHYFNYITSCRQKNLPTLLARILGVYSVGGGGVLVMENVWYLCGGAGDRARRFDLKGSSRHRLSADTRQAVLMDENLLNLRWERQLYIPWHTGSVLWATVERDTAFLAAHCVMDYSLLLGVEDNTLVLGIIDYIRTFTWDKKLEHLVKKNLGSGQPTVVSPEQYRRRFCTALRKYFLQCPSHWDHLHAGAMTSI